MSMWTREEMFWVAERLEPVMVSLGAHVAIAGSVMYRGHSDKDLDLIIYPHNNDGAAWDTFKLKMEIVKFFNAGKCNDCEGISQVRDGKEVVWLTTPKGKRVDIFFLK